MTWVVAVFSIALVIGIALYSAMRLPWAKNGGNASSTEAFLLAKGSLRSRSVVSLLLSSSFGINALLYAAWLGFSVGLWGLVIQAAWGVSFLLLSPFSQKLRATNSLHDFLGDRFGAPTRVIAALCTLAGFTYLIGWELAIGRVSTLQIITKLNELPAFKAQLITNLLMAALVLGTLVYTIWDGMAAQAIVDQILNMVKIVIIGAFSVLLITRFIHLDSNRILTAMFPSIAVLKQNLGFLGLVTNILFNLVWQFVDNSSWQSVIAGADATKRQSAQNLRRSGFVIFLTIGFLGTLFGVSLAGVSGVTPDNILTQAISLLPVYQAFIAVTMLLLVACCVMSLLDGLFLSSTFTLTMDVVTPNGGTTRHTNTRSGRTLPAVRLALVAIAIVATWGVDLLFSVTHLNLFDFVYIVIITQLALFGPVIITLVSEKPSSGPMWISIIGSLLIGFSSVWVGTVYKQQALVDGAGAFALVASTILAYLIWLVGRKRSEIAATSAPSVRS